MPEPLTLDDFVPAVGQAFVLRGDGDVTVELELVRARPVAAGSPGGGDPGRRMPFALDFRGPAQPALPQATYRMENDALGVLEVFIVPVAGGESGRDYEAIFA